VHFTPAIAIIPHLLMYALAGSCMVGVTPQPEYVVVVDRAVYVRDPPRPRGGPLPRPSPSDAVTAPRLPGAARVSQRPSRSAGRHSPCRPDSDRRETGFGPATGAALRVHSAGTSGHPGGDTIEAKAHRGCHPITRRAASPKLGAW
jgi:hypothetical protein